MGTVFAILLIGLALFSVVAVMVIVLREKTDHEAHLRYRQSPWDDDMTDAPVGDAREERTAGEALTDSVMVPDGHAEHTPLTEHVTPRDQEEKS